MHYPCRRVTPEQLAHCVRIHDIQPLKQEALMLKKLSRPSLFQPHAVVRRKIIDPNHAEAGRNQPLGDMVSDEPCRPSDEHSLHHPSACSAAGSGLTTGAVQQLPPFIEGTLP